MKYHYFVSYTWSNNSTGGFGYGSLDLTRNQPIRNWDDITEIKEAIEKNNSIIGSACVINWRRFENDE
jgi:hypothetical protein